MTMNKKAYLIFIDLDLHIKNENSKKTKSMKLLKNCFQVRKRNVGRKT